MFSFQRKDPTLHAREYTHGWVVAPLTDLNRLAKCVDQFVWSPIIFKDGYRIRANFVASHFCALDFDDEGNSLAFAADYFRDSQHIIGLSRNHQKIKHPGEPNELPACDRFRIVIPWERPITDLPTYETSMVAAMHEMTTKADLIPDRSPKDGARFFYPSKIFHVETDKDCYAQKVVAKTRTDVSDKRYINRERVGSIPPLTRADLGRIIPEGERNNTFYLVANSLARIGLTHEQAMTMVLSSATYQGVTLTDTLMRGLKSCVANGWRDGSIIRSRNG